MIFDFDITLLIKRMLPTFLQKEKQVTWLKILTRPLKTLKEDFASFREEKLFELSVNGQTFNLEWGLNYLFKNELEEISTDKAQKIEILHKAKKEKYLYYLTEHETQTKPFFNVYSLQEYDELETNPPVPWSDQYSQKFLFNSFETGEFKGYDFVISLPVAWYNSYMSLKKELDILIPEYNVLFANYIKNRSNYNNLNIHISSLEGTIKTEEKEVDQKKAYLDANREGLPQEVIYSLEQEILEIETILIDLREQKIAKQVELATAESAMKGSDALCAAKKAEISKYEPAYEKFRDIFTKIDALVNKYKIVGVRHTLISFIGPEEYEIIKY